MSVAAVATGVRPMHVAKILPAAVQSAMPSPPPPPQVQARPAPAYSSVPPAVAADIARWNSLRQTDSLPFSAYASFLMSHRGWPGETAMRRTAEKANSDGGAAYEVIGFFSAFPALTPAGHARQAFALQASGRGDEALEAARRAWTGGVLPPTDEARILSQFGGRLSGVDHDSRLEALLANGDTQSAARQLPLASAPRQALYSTRLALQTRAPDAAGRLAALGSVEGDPGLLMDRANWLRGTGQSLAARQLMAQPRRLSRPPANAEKWFESMMTLAKGAANDVQWSTAYGIASQLDDAYPAGTDVSGRSYGERDEYTNLAWLAGNGREQARPTRRRGSDVRPLRPCRALLADPDQGLLLGGALGVQRRPAGAVQFLSGAVGGEPRPVLRPARPGAARTSGDSPLPRPGDALFGAALGFRRSAARPGGESARRHGPMERSVPVRPGHCRAGGDGERPNPRRPVRPDDRPAGPRSLGGARGPQQGPELLRSGRLPGSDPAPGLSRIIGRSRTASPARKARSTEPRSALPGPAV